MKDQLATACRVFLGTVATAVTVTGVLIGSAVPASAHFSQNPVHDDSNHRLGFAEVLSDHRGMAVCDTRADGVGVFGRFELTNGQVIDIADPDGSGPDCGRGSIPSGPAIARYKAISRNGFDSGWKEA